MCATRCIYRGPLSDVSAVRSMDMLLQCVEESEDVGDVGRTTAKWGIVKYKQSACTVSGSTMWGQHSA